MGGIMTGGMGGGAPTGSAGKSFRVSLPSLFLSSRLNSAAANVWNSSGLIPLSNPERGMAAMVGAMTCGMFPAPVGRGFPSGPTGGAKFLGEGATGGGTGISSLTTGGVLGAIPGAAAPEWAANGSNVSTKSAGRVEMCRRIKDLSKIVGQVLYIMPGLRAPLLPHWQRARRSYLRPDASGGGPLQNPVSGR